LKHLSIPQNISQKASCVIKNTLQGDAGDKFKAWHRTFVITCVKELQSKDAPKLFKECGYKTPEAWKQAWMERHLFPPNPQDIVYAHFFEEVQRK
jgi:hypothetical protein